MLRPLYDWALRMAGHKHGVWVLAAISFIESSFFPIPPDVVLLPMAAARRDRAFWYATVCTVSSVIGAFLGYAIGYYLFEEWGRAIFETYHLMDTYNSYVHGFDEWGAWIIIIKGWTPIPFKLLTIASGAAHFNLLAFFVACVISRSMRFFLVAALVWKFGDPILGFIEKRLTLVTTAFVVLLVGGFVAMAYI